MSRTESRSASMGEVYKFITSTAAYEGFKKGEHVRIEFIAVLTSVSYRNTHFLLELQNFADGEPDAFPYLIKLRCTDSNSKKLARMTLSLLFQSFDIETPENMLDESFYMGDLHTESLSVLDCKCYYASKGTTYTIFLEDLEPVNPARAMNMVLKQRESPQGKIMSSIFHNLALMDDNPSNPFRFSRLNCYQGDFIQFVNKIKGATPVKTSTAPLSNPLFAANRLQSPLASQNEFDSQFMGAAGSFDTLRFDAIENSSSAEDSPLEQPKKRAKYEASTLRPGMSASAALGSAVKVLGRMVGMYPIGSNTDRDLRLYFVPHDWPCLEDTNLVHDVNCLEVIVQPGTRLHELFCKVYEAPSMFTDILKEDYLPIEIVRTKWALRDDLHSSYWALKHVGQEEEMFARLPKPTSAPQTAKEQFALFKDITAVEHPPRYFRMIGLLVSCTFEETKSDRKGFINMVFTDFTENTIGQKLLLEPFLIDFNNKLEGHQGFRALMYRDDFSRYDQNIRRAYGYSLKDMRLPNCGQNLSHKGIVCKLLLKVKLFDGKLNAIIRQFEPITRDYTFRYKDEEAYLKRFHRAAFERIGLDAMLRHEANYTKCFPPLPTSREMLSRPQPLKNMLQLDDIADYDVHSASDIAELNKKQHETRILYRVEGQVLAVHHSDDTSHIEILISNDLISADYADPARILRITIPSGDSLRFFLSASDASFHDAVQELRMLGHDEELRFRILRRPVRVAGFQSKIAMAMIWCPIECTLQELRSQALRHSQVKPEHDTDTFLVKFETEA